MPSRRRSTAVPLAAILLGAGLVSFGAARQVASSAATTTHASPSTTSTSSTTTTPAPDETALAGACAAVPSGSVPAFLRITAVRALLPADDPRTHVQARQVQGDTSASAVGTTTPYTVIAVIQSSAAPASGQRRPIDNIGTVQLVLSFDGTTKHKAVRTFQDGHWTARADTAADDLTFVVAAKTITFFWTGLHRGDRVGMITAADSGCGAGGLTADGAPILISP
jgi:hypothetical protein